jgi:hypothetical protein
MMSLEVGRGTILLGPHSAVIQRIAEVFIDLTLDVLFFMFPMLKNSRFERRMDRIFGPQASIAIDERLRKIELARSNLQDALSAIDELETSALNSREELDRLQFALSIAATENENLSAHNTNLRTVTEAQMKAIRASIEPTPREVWRNHAIGFLVGCLTTFIFSLGYDFAIKPLFLQFFPALAAP